MASIRSTIELIITGSTRGLNAAANEARAMASRIADAEDRVSAARQRSAAAESQVADVEARLAGARAQHTAALSQIGVAETNLEQARARAGGSTTRLSQAEERLESLRRGGASAETIARAEADIARVRTEADTAASNLQRAEANLERARANASRRAGDITALEERLARARGNAFRASEDLARSEANLNTLRRRGNDDINRQRDGILGIFDAFTRLGQAFSGADGASTSLLAKMSALHSVFTSIGGPIVQAVVGILEIVAVLGAAGEIIGVVGGLIGQVIATAPALLLAAGAAAATFALGMDGIKKAAQAAAPAFEKLKASVSGVFERELTPFFQRIGQVLPQLTAGFGRVAVSLSQVAKEVIAFVTSAKGLTTINSILNGTAELFRAMAPGIATFVKGLLDAANIGGSAFQRLGAALGTVFDQLGGVFTRLADNGTIKAAVDGLSSVIIGLGNVLGPVIELLIRMGAALGPTLGSALTELGNQIQTSIPFFEHLAQVAGEILVNAFNTLGPTIRDVITQLLPGANQGLDGFANVINTVVIPAINDFIKNLPKMIEQIKAFFLAATVNALTFASTFLTAISSILGVLHDFFAAMALIPGPMQESFARAAATTDAFRGKVDELKKSTDGLKDKAINLQLKTQGVEAVQNLKSAIDTTSDKVVSVISNVFGTPNVVDMHNQIALTNSKSVDVKANVPDTPKIVDMHNQIALTNSKTVQVTANVSGTSAVQALRSAIDAVKSKTVSIIANVTRALGLASGGPAQAGRTYLVGEKGPELLTLGRTSGFVTPAHKTRQLLAGAGRDARRSADGVGTPRSLATVGGDQPIHVTVNLSQEQIAGIAQVEIARRDRATKRTVLAGSGVTF